MGGGPQSKTMLMAVRPAATLITITMPAVVMVIVVSMVESSLPPLRPQAARVEGVSGLAVPAGMPLRDPPARATTGKLVPVLSGEAAALLPPPPRGAVDDGANITFDTSPTPGGSTICQQHDAAGSKLRNAVLAHASTMCQMARVDGLPLAVPASVDYARNLRESGGPHSAPRRPVSASRPRGPTSGRQDASRRGTHSTSPFAPAEGVEYSVNVDTRNHAQKIVEPAHALRLRPLQKTGGVISGCHNAVARWCQS